MCNLRHSVGGGLKIVSNNDKQNEKPSVERISGGIKHHVCDNNVKPSYIIIPVECLGIGRRLHLDNVKIYQTHRSGLTAGADRGTDH